MSNQLTNALPEFVDPMRLAETRQVLKGRVAVAAMPRLMASLDMPPSVRGGGSCASCDVHGSTSVAGGRDAESDRPPHLGILPGEVDVDLAFSVDGQGVRRVLGSLHAELDAICQRCLQPMILPLHVNIALGIVRALDEAEHLPDEYEPLVLAPLTEGQPQSLASIIEDELLLALPVAPLHAEGQCPVRSGALDRVIVEDLPPEGKKRPFAVLAGVFSDKGGEKPLKQK